MSLREQVSGTLGDNNGIALTHFHDLYGNSFVNDYLRIRYFFHAIFFGAVWPYLVCFLFFF